MKFYTKKDRFILFTAIFLGGINAALSAFVSLLLQKVIDVAMGKSLTEFQHLFIFMLIYLGVLGLVGFLEAYCGKILLRSVSKNLRQRVFQGIMKQTPTLYTSKNTADYLSALVNDIKLIEENYLIPLLLSSQMFILFITTLGILFYLSPVVTLILLAFLILMFVVPALLGKGLQKRQDEYSEKLSTFTAKTKDFLNGYEVIRGYSISPYINRRFLEINKETADKKFAADKLLAINETFSDLLSALTITVVVFVSAYLVLKGQITMGTLLALLQLSGTFVTPVVLLMQNIPKIAGMKPIWERLGGFMQMDKSCDKKQQNSDNETLHREILFQYTLECSNVSFSYQDNLTVLNKLNLRIDAGGKYLLLGESGGGKSTLIKLLTGYYQDFDGSIELDGIELSKISQHNINRLIAVIHQNIFLFDTDVHDNICLGETYSSKELQDALETSGVSQFLPQLEQGIHTPVGENGMQLSGGQRQRIAVARALIRKTPILIMDEGTSAVDLDTAYEIEKNLLLQEDLTMITITHHMNEELLPFYDQVLQLMDGQLKTLSI